MPPGHPPSGGTFFVAQSANSRDVPQDFRLLIAHETFPGHHLLDASRWNLDNRLRRHIEFPIFYEGWASFSEEILFDTGFFAGPIDRLLLAKRRYWRAVRGLVDLDIQTGARSLGQAAEHLCRIGLNRNSSHGAVRRYALKPGYQLSYTMGRCEFRKLYNRALDAGWSPAEFTRQVLEEGEIGLDNLERVFFDKT
jgi:uncharacterized protein (DUF885 family)